MRYIIYAYNYATLCRAMRYIDTCWGKEFAHIIYTDNISALPKALETNYHITVVRNFLPYKQITVFKSVACFLNNVVVTNRIKRKIRRLVDEKDENTILLFRDNANPETEILESLNKIKGKYKINFTVMEEGAGLYIRPLVKHRASVIKRIIYRLFGLSNYIYLDNPQGCNPLIDEIICDKPQLLEDRKKINKRLKIKKQMPVFTPDFSRSFIEQVVGETITKQSYDYVFVTAPANEIPGLVEKYDRFLHDLFSVTSQYGKLIIKPHPRDKYDYSPFCSDAVEVCQQKMNAIPFECLHGFYGHPTVLTFFSSACINLEVNEPSVYLYRLLNIEGLGASITEDFLTTNNIRCCDTFEELDMMLSQ